MLKKLYPYEYVDSVFEIDYDKLYAQGIRGLIFDIDNTLVLHGTDSTPEVDALFHRLKRNVSCVLFRISGRITSTMLANQGRRLTGRAWQSWN